MVYLSIDYGDRRIGLAAGSIETGLAEPLGSINSGGWTKDIAKIVRIAKERGAAAVVIGLPLNMDGSEGRRAEITRKFGGLLGDASGLPIIYHDERMTSREASGLLARSGLSRQRRQLIIDSVSAQLILEGYFRSAAGK